MSNDIPVRESIGLGTTDIIAQALCPLESIGAGCPALLPSVGCCGKPQAARHNSEVGLSACGWQSDLAADRNDLFQNMHDPVLAPGQTRIKYN